MKGDPGPRLTGFLSAFGRFGIMMFFFVVLFFTVNDIFDFSLSLVFVLFRNDMKNKF